MSLSKLKAWKSKSSCYAPVFGEDDELLASKKGLFESVYRTFVDTFGSEDQPVTVTHVPGRIEVLGKHTDYAGGPVLNMAASRGFMAISAPNKSRSCVFKENVPEWAPFAFNLNTGDWHPSSSGDTHWVTYPQRTLQRVAGNFGHDSLSGVDIAFGSDLPPASGMSSSSAVMIMTFLSLLPHSPLQDHPRFKRLGLADNKLLLAHYLACCENGQSFVIGDDILEGSAGVGTFGGSQDQTAIFTARQGKLSVNWFCPARWELDVDLPKDLSIVAAFSGFRAEKTQAAKDAFNRLSARAKAIPEAYNRARGSSFKWASDLLEVKDVPAFLKEVKDEGLKTLDLPGRYQSFFNESKVFIPQAVSALKSGNHRELGEILQASHQGSKRFLQNITPEIDQLATLANENGAYGASGFGGGFGGSVFAVIDKSEAPAFLDRWQREYLKRVTPPHAPEFFLCPPVSCARELFV